MAPGDDPPILPVDAEDDPRTVEELKQENERLREAEPWSRQRAGWRRISSWVLVVLACLLAVVLVVVVFARNQLLNTDSYVDTVAPLATNPASRPRWPPG